MRASPAPFAALALGGIALAACQPAAETKTEQSVAAGDQGYDAAATAPTAASPDAPVSDRVSPADPNNPTGPTTPPPVLPTDPADPGAINPSSPPPQ